MLGNMFRSSLKNRYKYKKGFTLIELLLVSGMSAILFGLIIFSLVGFRNTSSQQSSTASLVSDIKSQQFKAMMGETEGRADSDNYGIYFYADRYVLFHGSSFNPNDSTNFTVDLPEDLAIESVSFPNSVIIFEKLSGEILGFVPGSDSLTIRALNVNKEIVITLNRYGVITQIN